MEAGGERPVVGIACGQFVTPGGVARTGVAREYIRAIEAAGGLPLLLPLVEAEELLSETLERLQGLLLVGGGDVDPQRFGEEPVSGLGEIDPERDAFEIGLARLALERDMPVLGICRGIQVLNVSAGGTLYQDIPSQVPRAIKHQQDAPRWYPCHEVRLESESRLATIFQADCLRVNSFHHQSVKVAAPIFRVSAKARDAVVEGIESREHRFVVGVQWHPESMVERYPIQRLLFAAFIKAARGFRPGRPWPAGDRAAAPVGEGAAAAAGPVEPGRPGGGSPARRDNGR